MAEAVLVVTAAQAFGELIQQTLDETRLYRVSLAASANEALIHLQQAPISLLILDAETLDQPLAELGPALQAAQPDLLSLIIPPNNDPSHPSLSSLNPSGFLTKPFYIPDLLDTVAETLRRRPLESLPSAPARAEAVAPAWLADVARAAQQLTRLTLSSAALAALIVQQGTLWAYAGQLPQEAAQELAAAVAARHNHKDADLACYLRLSSAPGEVMLYATPLADHFILALAFDAQTPFSKMRAQASQLSRSLARPDEPPPPFPAATPPTETPNDPAPNPPPAVEILPLFDDVPPPMPLQSQPSAPTLTLQPRLDIAQPVAESDTQPTIISSSAPAVERPSRALPPSQFPTAPAEATRQLDLAPISPAVCSLQYSCMLIPRLPAHYLTGELAARIAEWAGQICIAFGWRLEGIAVRPDYLQWSIAVPPNTSPGYLMRQMRQQTSQRIFALFPPLAAENPSGDFWAPGYLIMSSSQPPPAQVVKDFIANTRRYQGLAAPHPTRPRTPQP